MTARGGRPRTFPTGIVPIAVERRDRTGETWEEIGRDLGVHPGTLRTRAAEFLRETRTHKTPGAAGTEGGAAPDTSEGGSAP